MPSEKDARRNEKWRKRYLAIAQKTIRLAEKEKLDFDLEWLKSLTGVVRWIETNAWITDPQIRAIINSSRAVRNIIKYRKLKEKRHGDRMERRRRGDAASSSS